MSKEIIRSRLRGRCTRISGSAVAVPLKQEPVVIPTELRPVIGGAVVERLTELGAQVICASLGGQHGHLLGKMPASQVRAWVGLAKEHTWFVAREHGWSTKLWGKRSKAVHVTTRAHQLNVYRYILRHAEEGAWVWTFREDAKRK